MSVLIEFSGGLREPTLNEMVDSLVRVASAGPHQDRLAAQYNEQKLYVGLGYVTAYLFDRDRALWRPNVFGPHSYRPSDIVGLDACAVAEHGERTARPEAKAGIARTVRILIDSAREALAAQCKPTPKVPRRAPRKSRNSNSH